MLTIDDDLIEQARAVAKTLDRPVGAVVNEALRIGLDAMEGAAESRRYETQPHHMGLRAGLSLDNIQVLLAHVDREHLR